MLAGTYSLFLDRDRQYSCAYFPKGSETLEEAQEAKKRHIAAKLCLGRPGLSVLDIGCGWGGMALTLARDYGATVTGITLSTEQLAEAKARAEAQGLARKQREQKREQERTDKTAEHKRKEKEKAFESLISLPSEQQETRLGELAKRLDEDVAAIRDDFTAFVGMQSRAASTNSWNVELWPDPVENSGAASEDQR